MAKQKKLKKTNIIIFLLVVNLIATGVIGYSYFSNFSSNNEIGIFNPINGDTENSILNYTKGDKYTLYIGTNDKDTKNPILTEKAVNIVNSICDKHVTRYSVFISRGYGTNNLNQSEHENTLVYIFYNASESQIKLILDETLEELNQESILVEKGSVYYTFYKK